MIWDGRGTDRQGGHCWAVECRPLFARLGIAKDKSIDRVDGLVALAMAIGLYNREPAPLVYDFDRPLVLSV